MRGRAPSFTAMIPIPSMAAYIAPQRPREGRIRSAANVSCGPAAAGRPGATRNREAGPDPQGGFVN